jgi:hypothetical protein
MRSGKINTLEIKTSEVLVALLNRISSGKLRKSAASLNVVYLLYTVINRQIFLILILAIYASAGCTAFREDISSSGVIVENGISYSLETDKSEYVLGESVNIRYRITNQSEEVKELGSVPNCESCVPQFVVKRGEQEIWRTCRVIPPCGTGIFLLNPNESREYSLIWPMLNDHGTLEPGDDFPIKPGVYTVIGKLWSLDDNLRVPVSVKIKIR